MEIKFIHIADLHLGARPVCPSSVADRGEELWEALGYVLDVCEKESVHLLLIAGDLFHSRPSTDETDRLSKMFAGLSHTLVVLIAGNHDYVTEKSAYFKTDWPSNVRLLLERSMQTVELFDGFVSVTGFSFDRQEIAEPVYDCVEAPGKCPVEILLAHGGDSRHAPFTAETMLRKKFTYMALGHIHKPVTLGHNAAYPGALCPVDTADTGSHGYIVGCADGSRLHFERRRIPFREYRNIDVSLTPDVQAEDIRQFIARETKRHGVQHMYTVRFTGEVSSRLDLSSEAFRMYIDSMKNIVLIDDGTQAGLDLEQIKETYRDGLIGEFISVMEKRQMPKEAVEIGVRALLEQADGRI